MIATYLLLLAAVSEHDGQQCPVSVGTYVAGFETSYFVPEKGAYRGRKIWIEDSNKLQKQFDKSHQQPEMWKRAKISIRGCIKAGRFGALGLYRLSIASFEIIDFLPN